MAHTKTSRKQACRPATYSLIDVLLASATTPTPAPQRAHQLTRMYEGLRSIERDASPTPDDWRVVCDAVNLMETLVSQDVALDASGLLQDAARALKDAAIRYKTSGVLRLDATGIQSVRAVLEDYAEALEILSHRTMVNCHRLTEAHIHAIQAGRPQPHDIDVTKL